MASFTKIQQRLKSFDFVGLFTQELRWNNYKSRDLDIPVDGRHYTLVPTAEQSGMAVYVCTPATAAEFPDYPTRRKIDNRVAKVVREHIVIYQDPAKKFQIWQWVKREAGKASACREQRFEVYQTGDALIQKLLQITFSLEDDPTIGETREKVKGAFDLEKVTRRFYEEFKKQHAVFLKFFKGIPDEHLQRWYASVMLNRLMFIYFIQKKGFLGGDINYLRNKLAESKKHRKAGFYREFLCPLFFEGFAKRETDRSAKTKQLLGSVPYLNGGLFLKHQIEQSHWENIEIADSAFDKIFGYFDQYQWHLDDRPTGEGNEINPDVLGYVFEKYVNQREMGAYYTKEDITGYIGQNTIIPAVFDVARKGCKVAFEGEHCIWSLLKEDPDRYFYAAVLHGTKKELPKNIAAGINDASQRGDWNKTAPEEYGLATETWREAVARRQRYEEVRAKLASGDVQSINDLITYNLDIQRFAEEVISNAEGADLVWAFYKAVEKLSVLDPTCGSGAFLLAALNILERIYDTCLVRMQAFVDDLDRSVEKHSPKRFEHFRLKLAEMNDKSKHPSPRYFILKSIILNNLYGVDIMEEATEICKLRLFLKLVAQLKPDDRIEPLPDIDFNIRAGNALVGFATENELHNVLCSKFDFENKIADIKEGAGLAELAYSRFREMQVHQDMDPEDFRSAKEDLRTRMNELGTELDHYLAGEYGIKKGDQKEFGKWRQSHQPFHWFVAFYGIMSGGGFDAVIGNPPYIEYKKVRTQYSLLKMFDPFATNLYSACAFRSSAIKSRSGYASLIVPVSLPSTDRMEALRQFLSADHTVHYTSFSTRPAKLFDGAEQRLTIYIQSPSETRQLYSGGYLKWYSSERDHLFAKIAYVPVTGMAERRNIWPKLHGAMELAIFGKLQTLPRLATTGLLGGNDVLYYKNTGLRYFNTVTLEPPKCWINGKKASSSRETLLNVLPTYKGAIHAYLISSLFFFHYQATTNCRDLNPSDILLAPDPGLRSVAKELRDLSRTAEHDYRAKAKIIRMNNKLTGRVEVESLTPANSKKVIDEIDGGLGHIAGFSNELIDYVINYDIKYRLGQDADGEESEVNAESATAN